MERSDLPMCKSCEGTISLAFYGNRYWCPDCLWAEIERLQGDIIRLEHVVAVLKTAIGQAHLSATHIEDHTRVRNGRLEVWCLGDWVDVEKANAEAEAEAKEEE